MCLLIFYLCLSVCLPLSALCQAAFPSNPSQPITAKTRSGFALIIIFSLFACAFVFFALITIFSYLRQYFCIICFDNHFLYLRRCFCILCFDNHFLLLRMCLYILCFKNRFLISSPVLLYSLL